MNLFTRWWDALARLAPVPRVVIKLVLFGLVVLFVSLPNPVLTVKQLQAYLNTEALFDSEFPEMQQINTKIDSLLPPDYTFEQEYRTVVRFVYDHIKYEYDWDNWLNSEYWPNAHEVWQRGREDCDGRAILAVAIFRARGYADANIVGSMRHLWIRVGDNELMGPDKEKLVVVEDGKKTFLMPSLTYMLEAMAGHVFTFPTSRMIAILMVFLLMLLHPVKNAKLILSVLLVGVFGFLLILDWAKYVTFYDRVTFTASFVFGTLLLLAAVLIAMFSKKLLRRFA